MRVYSKYSTEANASNNMKLFLILNIRTIYHMFLCLLSEILLFHKLIDDTAPGSVLIGWYIAVRIFVYDVILGNATTLARFPQ